MSNKNYVPIDRVRPLVAWLHDRYGSYTVLSDVMKVPATTLRNISDPTRKTVKPDIAEKIVVFVKQHRRPSQGTIFDKVYENGDLPRLPTSEEKALSKRRAS